MSHKHRGPGKEEASDSGLCPTPCTSRDTPSPPQSPQKGLQRTLSDESLCSGRREPSFATGPEPGLPSDVLFSSTCAFPASTLPARRQHPHTPGGPTANPATGNGFPEKKCEPGIPWVRVAGPGREVGCTGT